MGAGTQKPTLSARELLWLQSMPLSRQSLTDKQRPGRSSHSGRTLFGLAVEWKLHLIPSGHPCSTCKGPGGPGCGTGMVWCEHELPGCCGGGVSRLQAVATRTSSDDLTSLTNMTLQDYLWPLVRAKVWHD